MAPYRSVAWRCCFVFNATDALIEAIRDDVQVGSDGLDKQPFQNYHSDDFFGTACCDDSSSPVCNHPSTSASSSVESTSSSCK